MGIMLQRSKIAEDLLVAMAQLFGPVPGGLGISVVFVGALLAATTGIVGATVKDGARIPTNLLADEKHSKAHGEKWYIATTVAQDCVLGAAVTTAADTVQLKEGYGVFKQEAEQLNPEYEPKTVNTDGWAATRNAWQQLFPNLAILLCFYMRSLWFSLTGVKKERKKQVFSGRIEL